jgi:hypothetical protein
LPMNQGCQTAYFQTNIFNLGKFWFVLHWKMMVNFMTIGSDLRPFGIFTAIWYIYGHLVYFVDSWFILWTVGLFCGQLVYFVDIWYIHILYVVQMKIWQPCNKHMCRVVKSFNFKLSSTNLKISTNLQQLVDSF